MNLFHRLKLDIQELGRRIRSYRFCCRYLPFEQARKMPFYLECPVKVLGLQKGQIVIPENAGRRQIWMGGGMAGVRAGAMSIFVGSGAKIVFEGGAFFGDGCSIRVDEDGLLTFGDGFGANRNCFIRCSDKVTLGKNVMLGWDVEINDNDGHSVYSDGVQKPSKGTVEIGGHVWLASHVRVGKDVAIADGCIVAKGAVVTKKHLVPNTLIGGVPARDIRGNVYWRK